MCMYVYVHVYINFIGSKLYRFYRYIWIRTRVNVYAHIHVYAYTQVYMYIYIHTRECVRVCARTRACVCVCVCVYVFVCKVNMHIFLMCARTETCGLTPILSWLSSCLFVYLSIYQTVYLTVCLSVCLSVYPSVCLSVCLFVYFSLRLSLSLSLSDFLSARLSVCLPVCLSGCLSAFVSIYLLMRGVRFDRTTEPTQGPRPRILLWRTQKNDEVDMWWRRCRGSQFWAVHFSYYSPSLLEEDWCERNQTNPVLASHTDIRARTHTHTTHTHANTPTRIRIRTHARTFTHPQTTHTHTRMHTHTNTDIDTRTHNKRDTPPEAAVSLRAIVTLWHSWILEQSFLVWNLFYNNNFVVVLFGSCVGGQKVVTCFAQQKYAFTKSDCLVPRQCLGCVLPMLVWLATNLHGVYRLTRPLLITKVLVKRSTPCRFVGSQTHTAFFSTVD